MHLVQLGSGPAKTQEASEYHWQLVGDDVDRAYLQNRLTQGFLGPYSQAGDKVETAFSLPLYLLEAISKQNTKGSAAKSSMKFGRAIDGASSLRQTFADWQREKKLDVPLRYGDAIRLTSHATFEHVGKAVGGSLTCSSAGAVVGADNNDFVFIIKGEHKYKSRYNCSFGEPVQSGSKIRLEHLVSGKNLSLGQKLEHGELENKTEKTLPKAAQVFAVKLSGADGVGSDNDNWLVTAVGPQGKLSLGHEFKLTHELSMSVLFGDFVLVHGQNQNLHIPLAINMANAASKKEDQPEDEVEKLEGTIKNISMQGQQAAQELQENKKAQVAQALDSELIVDGSSWLATQVHTMPMPSQNVARTGYPGGAAFEPVDLDFTDNQVLQLNVVSLGQADSIAPGSDLWQKISLEAKQPYFTGLATEKVTNFNQSVRLDLPPMLSQGVAWLEKSLPIPNKTLLTFLVKVSDQGNAQIVFGNQISDKFVYKAVLGDGNNTMLRILKQVVDAEGKTQELELGRTYVANNFAARLSPGNYVPIWLSFVEGKFMVGAGFVPGQQVFLAAHDANFAQEIDRIGFSCDRQEVSFTGIKFGKNLEVSAGERTLYEHSEPLTGRQEFLHDLRSPLHGCLSFNLSGEQDAIIDVQVPKSNLGYRLEVHPNKNSLRLLRRGLRDKMFIPLGKAALPSKQTELPIWWSMANDTHLLGIGNVAENLVLACTDAEPIEQAQKIKIFVEPESNLTDFSLHSPCHIATALSHSVDESLSYFYKGAVQVIFPFRYQLRQEGPDLILQDFISKKTVLAGQVPQKSADYHLMLQVTQSGLPRLRWVWEPENKDMVRLQRKGFAKQAEADAYVQAASHIEGSGKIGRLIGSFASIGVGTLSLLSAKEAAAALAKAKYDFKPAADTKAFVDQSLDEPSMQAGIPSSAKQNRIQVENMVLAGRAWSGSNVEDLNRLIPHYLHLFSLINHPFVIEEASTKESVTDAINNMYSSAQELIQAGEKTTNLRFELARLLLTALDNAYFFDLHQAADKALHQTWHGWMSHLLAQQFVEPGNTFGTLPALHGKYIWLPQKLDKLGEGIIKFSVKGESDFFIALANNPILGEPGSAEFYELIIGANNNSVSIIRPGRYALPAAKTADPRLELSPIISTNFWLELKNGTLTLGLDQPSSESAVLSWTDPFAQSLERYVGLSSWKGELQVQFEN